MLKKTLPMVLALIVLSTGVFAYDFWGITMGTEVYGGGPQLTFSGAAGNAQFVVGSYNYTRVDSTWYGPFPAASPGLGYNNIHRSFDAMGLFVRPEANALKFMVITGMPQTGANAAVAGYGTRIFGPGDLKLDIGGHTYGVGFRLDNLLWAVDPNTTSAYFKIYKATGGADSIYARDAGTLGRVELDPRWDHVDHYGMAAYDEAGYAFYVRNSGTQAGTASVTFADTGLMLGTGHVYAYEATVPWDVLGIGAGDYAFRASWRPDCGNDLLAANFSGVRPPQPPVPPSVPEPMSVLLALSGFGGIAIAKRRYGV